jgi:hypothetical protein
MHATQGWRTLTPEVDALQILRRAAVDKNWSVCSNFGPRKLAATGLVVDATYVSEQRFRAMSTVGLR